MADSTLQQSAMARPVTQADLSRLEKKVDRLTDQLSELVEARRFSTSLYQEMAPIASEALAVGAERLAELEQRGYFDFARELLNVVDNIVAGYSPEDVHALADNVVRILGVVRMATQPEVLGIAEHAADAVEAAGSKKPPGVIGLLRATSKDEDARRGLAFTLSLFREIGKAMHRAPQRVGGGINPLLGPARNLFAPRNGDRAAARTSAKAPAPAAPAALRATAEQPAPVAEGTPDTLAGKPCDADGFLLDPAEWSDDLAEQIAVQFGVGNLSERHWAVVKFARTEFEETGRAPNIRRITVGSGVPTKELYSLFPRAPAKTVARIAGIPKPVGCL